jgi:hypothetical protein
LRERAVIEAAIAARFERVGRSAAVDTPTRGGSRALPEPPPTVQRSGARARVGEAGHQTNT